MVSESDSNPPKLRPFQIEGALWLASKRYALLGDDMGVGKSAQVVTACDILKLKTILIVCPAIAVLNWKREFEKFSTQERTFNCILSKQDVGGSGEVTIVSFDMLRRYLPALKTKYELLVTDECHFLKSIKAARTKAVIGKDRVLNKKGEVLIEAGVARVCKRAWFLSGTPAPNHPAELWPVLYTIGATKLKYEEFVLEFCDWYIPDRFGKEMRITGAKKESIPKLRELLKPVMMRRLKKNVLKELPPVIFQEVPIEPGEVDLIHASSFTKWVFPHDRREELAEKIRYESGLIDHILKSEKNSTRAIATLDSAEASISTVRRYWGLQKIDAVAAMVRQELKDKVYEKVVIFAIYRDVIHNLQKQIAGGGSSAVNIYGETPIEHRQRKVDNFQNDKETKCIILQVQAAGTAITLTSAHHVIVVEQSFVPADNAQAIGRVCRFGQKMPVNVRNITIHNSIDQRIQSILARKTQDLAAIFDYDEEKVLAENKKHNTTVRQEIDFFK